MKLKELLTGISVLECTADPELEIKEIFYDSRKVTPGSLFVAVSGFAADGNKFIPMAAEKGAAAVVTAKKPETDIPYVLVESDRLALALLGCNFFGRPAEHMTMIGITGTGKGQETVAPLRRVMRLQGEAHLNNAPAQQNEANGPDQTEDKGTQIVDHGQGIVGGVAGP